MTSPIALARRILDLYRNQGGIEYEGEGVSQLEHAAQCGALARAAGATLELQVAAWLHDIGHLLAALPGTPTLQGVDDRHEKRGASFLLDAFGPQVSEPVALHVAAKRYLVAVNSSYHERLSPDSQRSLELQGGPMSRAERRSFMQQPSFADALRIRVWDDEAKRPGKSAPGLIELKQLLEDFASRVPE